MKKNNHQASVIKHLGAKEKNDRGHVLNSFQGNRYGSRILTNIDYLFFCYIMNICS